MDPKLCFKVFKFKVLNLKYRYKSIERATNMRTCMITNKILYSNFYLLAIPELERLVYFSGKNNKGKHRQFLIDQIRFADETFNTTFISTIGIDFKVKTIEHQGKKIKLQVWDTAGQERFRTITPSYFRSVTQNVKILQNTYIFSGASGILLVYDYTNPKSFDSIPKYIENINKHTSDDVVRILIGKLTVGWLKMNMD